MRLHVSAGRLCVIVIYFPCLISSVYHFPFDTPWLQQVQDGRSCDSRPARSRLRYAVISNTTVNWSNPPGTDRKPLPLLRTICLHDQVTAETLRGRAATRIGTERASHKGTTYSLHLMPQSKITFQDLTTVPARIPDLPTRPPPRLRSDSHLLRPETKQPCPPPRNPH